MSQACPIEKRRAVLRYDTDFVCQFTFEGLAQDACIENLSLDGAFLRSRFLPPAGCRILITLKTPLLKNALAMEGYIVRTECASTEEVGGFAVKFSHTSLDLIELVKNLISQPFRVPSQSANHEKQTLIFRRNHRFSGKARARDSIGIAVTMNIEPGFLHACLTGEFSLKSAKEIMLEILNLEVQNNIEKVLVDALGVTGTLSMMDRFLLACFGADAVRRFRGPGVPRSTKVAIVAKPPILDPSRLAETVARNRGIIIKVTEDSEEALEWLGLAKDFAAPDCTADS